MSETEATCTRRYAAGSARSGRRSGWRRRGVTTPGISRVNFTAAHSPTSISIRAARRRAPCIHNRSGGRPRGECDSSTATAVGAGGLSQFIGRTAACRAHTCCLFVHLSWPAVGERRKLRGGAEVRDSSRSGAAPADCGPSAVAKEPIGGLVLTIVGSYRASRTPVIYTSSSHFLTRVTWRAP